MAKIPQPFTIVKRPDTETFRFTLNFTCGLPERVCRYWRRKSFISLPDELSHHRTPKDGTYAKIAVQALIAYLKKMEAEGGSRRAAPEDITVGQWIEKFTKMETSPRTGIKNAEGKPYSADSIENYLNYYNLHIKGDPLMALKMAELEEEDVTEFSTRLSLKKLKDGRPMSGTRTYVGIIKFIRMTFKYYQRKSRFWVNPWAEIKPPKQNSKPYDALTEDEIVKLFSPGVLRDTMELAVCAAMFTTGLRRSEIYALKPDNLDWHTPTIKVTNSWQSYNKTVRVLGPKKSKRRDHEVPFDPILQEAIKKLWEDQGKYEFVFSWGGKKKKPPGSSWLNRNFPIWLERAGIDVTGRDIVPHSSRHSLASMLLAKDTPIKYIQKLLDHSSPKTTERYMHVTSEAIRGMGDKISEVMKQEEKSNVLKFRVS